MEMGPKAANALTVNVLFDLVLDIHDFFILGDQADGYTVFDCIVCGCTIRQSLIPWLPHC